MPGEEGVLEIRPFYEMADFDHVMTDETRDREGRVRKLVERQQKPKAKSATKAKKAPAKAKSKASAKAKSKAPKRRAARAKSKK
jgi:hypothetical protein